MILRDTTKRFLEDLPNVASNIPTVVERVLEQNPGSYLGAAEFQDKPYRDLGEPDDFCYRLANSLVPDSETFQKAYNTLYACGGGDLPEAQLQALINVATDASAGWRALVNTRRLTTLDYSSQTGAWLVILSTDAVPHDPEDYNFYNGVWDDYLADEPGLP